VLPSYEDGMILRSSFGFHTMPACDGQTDAQTEML